MRISWRILTITIAAFGLVLPAAAMAAAEPYPVTPPALTVSAATVVAGDTVQVVGTGYGPNEPVNISTVTQPLALGRVGRSAVVPAAYAVPLKAIAITVIADANGSFVATLRLDEVGNVFITATGTLSGISFTVRVVVLPPGSALPVTGDDGSYLRLMLIGSAVAAAGVVLLVMVRSRRRPTKISS